MKPNCYSRWFEHNDVTEKDKDEYEKLVKRGIYDYFDISMKLYKKLNTYEALAKHNILPSETKTYSRDEIAKALSESFDDKQVFFKCDRYNSINEIWYYHLLSKGSPILNNDIDVFTAIDSFTSYSRCTAEGIHYYPKGYKPPAYKPPTSPGNGNKKKLGTGAVRISTKKGSLSGFLTNKGKWMSKGTEANYELYDAEFGNVNLKTRMGYCGVNKNNNMFECNSRYSKNPTQFNYDDSTGIISYLGKDNWYSTNYPSGRVQSNVIWKEDNNSKEYEYKLKFNRRY